MVGVAYFSEWFAGLVALFLLFTIGKKCLFPLIFYVLFVVVVDFCSRFVAIKLDNETESNHYYYNVAFVIEIVLFIYLSQRWKRPAIAKPGRIIPLYLVWILFSMLNLFVFQGFYTLNTWSFMAGYAIIIVLSSIQLFDLVQSTDRKSLFFQSGFWVWSGFLLSATFSFTYRAFELVIYFSISKLFVYIIISSAILKYIMLSIGMLCSFINDKQLKTISL